MTIHPRISCFIALPALAWLTASGCGLRLGGDDRPLVVIVSGDMSGWIAPCGCTTNQSGGLPRRGSFIEQLSRKARVVAVDVGGSLNGSSAYDLAKFEAILAGEILMGIEAHNIGAAEARLGPDVLRRLSAKHNIPFISANVRDAGGQLVAEPLRIVNASGRRLALVGVLSEKYAAEMIHISPPRQKILEIMEKNAGSFDSLIVLAYLPEDELQELAESIPEADVIVGGPTGQPIAPKRVGPVLLTSATNKGKFLARLEAPTLNSTDRWTASIMELNDRYADDPRQTANIEKFRQELARRDFTPAQTSLVEQFPANMPKNYTIAGNSTCLKCHQDDCFLWRKSKHSSAWNTLKSKGASYDPDCQRCHTTGYGLPGGFSSVARNGGTVDVGCESCHGPSKSHVINPDILTPYYAQAKDRCIQCHDRENSPQFNYDKYWTQIDHGESLDVFGIYIMENEVEDLQ